MRIEFTPRGLLTVFFRQKIKFLMTFLLVLLAGGCFIALSTPLYESTGSFLVKFGNSARPEVVNTDHQATQAEISQTGHEVIQSYVGILQSNNLLTKLISEFGPTKIYPELARQELSSAQIPDAAMKKFRHDLSIKSSEDNDIIEISLLNSDPQMAAQMVQRLQELFISLQTEVYNKSQTDFIDQQVQQAAKQLADDQEKLQAFKAKSGISSIDTEESSLLEEKNSVKTATLETTLESVSTAQENLDQLKAKEAQLMTTYKADSAPVMQIQQSVAVAQSQLDDRKRALAAGSARAGANAQGSSVGINSRIARLEGERSEYSDLSRQVQIDADNYKSYLSRLEDAKLNDKLNQQNITRVVVLDAPLVAAKPAKPSRPLIILFSIMAAIIFGFGMVLTAETMDERFSSPDQLSRLLAVPALAITAMKKHASGGAAKDIANPANTILSPTLPASTMMELFNIIKSGLTDKSSHIMQFVSAYNHEGANLVAFDMAAMVAIRTSLRVLFVDTSAEPEGVRRQLADAVNTLPDATSKNSNTVALTSAAVVIGTNLAYTTLHNREHTHESVFTDPQTTGALLETWRKMYDLVVIPSPAIMNDVAHRTLTKLTDGCVLVVEADRTRAPVVAQMQNMILSNGGHIACAVLNKRRLYIPKWVYRRLWL